MNNWLYEIISHLSRLLGFRVNVCYVGLMTYAWLFIVSVSIYAWAIFLYLAQIIPWPARFLPFYQKVRNFYIFKLLLDPIAFIKKILMTYRRWKGILPHSPNTALSTAAMSKLLLTVIMGCNLVLGGVLLVLTWEILTWESWATLTSLDLFSGVKVGTPQIEEIVASESVVNKEADSTKDTVISYKYLGVCICVGLVLFVCTGVFFI